MLTVRFPDGFSLSYGAAVNVEFREGHFILLDRENKWVAKVGNNCIVEAVSPSNFSNPNRNPATMIQFILDHLREMPLSRLAQLKSALHDFNATTRRWKR